MRTFLNPNLLYLRQVKFQVLNKLLLLGVGLDCYRTYEALYLGSYPIVKTSTLDPIFKNLPVLIVNEWTDLTEVLLKDTYTRFERQTFDYSTLYVDYWYAKFRSHA